MDICEGKLQQVYERLQGGVANPAFTPFVEQVRAGRSLTQRQAQEAMEILASGAFAERQAAAFLVALSRKGVTADELIGFAQTVRARAQRLEVILPPGVVLADTCGTGCDAAGTINISTTVMFILAAAGVCVAKHGNKAVTSRCGSADVLEQLGVKVSAEPEKVTRCIREVGIGFLFAPAFHTAFHHVQNVRRALMQAGVKTVFNYLGPLTNPAGARRQFVGVFHPDLTRLMAEAFQGLGSERALCVCGRIDSLPGRFLDEFSTLGATETVELREGRRAERRYQPEDFGFQRVSLDAIRGGDAAQNARDLWGILSGRLQGPKRDIVLLNAGAALYICKDNVGSIQEGIEVARESLDSGAALQKLERLKEISNAI